MNENLKELLFHIFSSMPEPHIQFKSEHKRNVRMMKNTLEKAPGVVHKLSAPILQNAFLYSCMELTKDETVEHLVVGFGRRYGGGTDIYEVLHIVGNSTSVSFPPGFKGLIKDHLAEDRSAQVLLFHNHPENWVNDILPGFPMASSTDRRTMLQMKYLEPFSFVRKITGAGTIKFYVAEDGNVKEIKWPYIKDILDTAAILQKRGGVNE